MRTNLKVTARPMLGALPALVFLLFAPKLRADQITYNITFTAAGDVPAYGSFVATFDPTKKYLDTTSGFTVLSFYDTFTPPDGFGFDYFPDTDELEIGGLINGAGGGVPNTNDFLLSIDHFTAAPTFHLFYATAKGRNSIAEDFIGRVSVVSQPAAVTPEPSGIALLGTGLLGIAGVVRRRLA